MKLVEYYFPLIFGDEAQEEVEKVRAFGHKLLKEYKRLHRSTENTSLFPSSSQSESSTTSGKHSRMAGFDTFVSLSVTADHVDGFDLLTWWKANSIKYPTLQKVARDLLAIPVSTVASESAFSTSGRFVSPHRNRLHPKTLEALMCARDWLWSDIHENSGPSSYFGACAKFDDEDVDEEESTLSFDGCQ
ncbi:zinc finger BED domain-containing protein DAYSLEEPER-like [Olea europaea var. sylvestris]|uniref:zinc finger BED domain-containing protein DAYSLEEPER-like n=1 Tax=Olea europaea var. sylvestris TaxID=158386 RepID=UPI000C1D8702|nr:zinc finger BED domain-containing protein DAYSLEEPER-like [Olea europaea var. sylvestris]